MAISMASWKISCSSGLSVLTVCSAATVGQVNSHRSGSGISSLNHLGSQSWSEVNTTCGSAPGMTSSLEGNECPTVIKAAVNCMGLVTLPSTPGAWMHCLPGLPLMPAWLLHVLSTMQLPCLIWNSESKVACELLLSTASLTTTGCPVHPS